MTEGFPQKIPAFSKDASFDIKQSISTYVKNWPLILLCAFTGLAIGFLYLRYTTPTYQVYSKILIKSAKTPGSTPDILTEIDFLNTGNSVDGENEILKTGYLLRKVVDELNLNVQYFIKGSFKRTELYKTAPFKISVTSLQDSTEAKELNFHFLSASTFSINSDNINGTFRFNDTIKTPEISFVVKPQASKNSLSKDYVAIITNPETLTNNYLYTSFITIETKLANLIQMQLQETVPRKGEDMLNKLYEIYTRINQENKNTVVDSSISFIDSRLNAVTQELSGVEENLEQFKRNNQLPSTVQDKAKLAVANSSELQKQLVQQDVQLLVIESVENYIKNNTGRTVPAASGIRDPAYLETVQKYNNWVLERDRQLSTTRPDNPLIKNLDAQIEGLKKDLVTSLENAKASIRIDKGQLTKTNFGFLQDIKAVPSKERALLDISRQQNLKQELYLYLLKKREEIAISKTNTLSNSRLIEPARTNPIPLSPKTILIYLITIGAGFIFPAIFIFFRKFFNNKITGLKDITSITNIPVLGEIGHRQSKDVIVFRNNLRSASAEQFRTLRTNLELTFAGKPHQVIMITSGIIGEGKTFSSINIGSSLAISGKKVILVEFDLRKPSISRVLSLSKNIGISSFLNSENQIDELIQQSSIHPNLFVIGSGPIPDNPGELLIQDKMSKLFEHLRSSFDHIVLDTPPLSIVSDALVIGKYADVTIYVVRQNFSFSGHIEIINDLFENAKVPNLSIIMNDTNMNSNYGYKKGYRNHYIDDKEQKYIKKKNIFTN
ncbi:MAG: polysaccharide biosynthesis tyrosine autokinase [Ferruginibacter sp.]